MSCSVLTTDSWPMIEQKDTRPGETDSSVIRFVEETIEWPRNKFGKCQTALVKQVFEAGV